MTSRPQPGYYAGFRTLDQQRFWDAKTREVIVERVNHVPAIRYFEPEQARLLEAICRHVIPQEDRDESHRIPIVPQIDKRLFDDTHDGYRYQSMPPDREAYALGLRTIEQLSLHLHERPFLALNERQQDELIERIHDGHLPIENMPVDRFWMLLVQDCIEAYYAHPWAWDEIGFGGPAYPRAYMRLERGEPEPWETEEQRYEWNAPETSVSDKFTPIAGHEEHHGGPQGGTH